jgi:hypothetical protein
MENKQLKGIDVSITKNVSLDRIADVLCAGFEGGVNYWAKIHKYDKPSSIFSWGTIDGLSMPVCKYVQYPLSPGGAVYIEDEEEGEGKVYKIDLDTIVIAVQLLAKKYPRMMQDILIQLAAFGEVIYG